MDEQVAKKDKGEQSEAGFYCKVCDCIVKDSLNYLDHCNGKRHLRNLGVSVKTFVDSTYEEVKEMLEFKRRERDERLLGYSLQDSNEVDEETYRRLKREKKKRQKARKVGGYFGDADLAKEEEEGGSDKDEDAEDELGENEESQGEQDGEDAMARIMGFSNFSSSKR